MISDVNAHDQQPLLAGVKCCYKCKKEKPYSEFYVKNKNTGLLRHDCKACCIDKEKKRVEDGTAWGCKPENKEKKNQIQKENYWVDPNSERMRKLEYYNSDKPRHRAKRKENYYANRDDQIAKSSQWNRDNPERVRAWKEANRPSIRASVKKHRLLHPESHLNSRSIRRTRKIKGTVEHIKPGMDARLMEQQNGKCPYCAVSLTRETRHRDHVIPLALNGAHAEYNFQLTCIPCNLKKHAKHPLDFAAEMGIVQNPIYIPI